MDRFSRMLLEADLLTFLGECKGAAPISNYNLETREVKLQGEDKDNFLRYLWRILCWLPEERATAKELLFDI